MKEKLEIFNNFFEKWNNALQTRNPEKVDELYLEDCLFMPTFPEKGKEIVKKDGVADYFSHFLLKKPLGTVVKVEVQDISDNIIKYAGLYNFEVGEENNRTISPARFIFDLKKDGNDEYRISFHGSFPIN